MTWADKILHFYAGAFGWLICMGVYGVGFFFSYLIIFIAGGLWEGYYRITQREEFDYLDWGFALFGALAMHLIYLRGGLQVIGWLVFIVMGYVLAKSWWYRNGY